MEYESFAKSIDKHWHGINGMESTVRRNWLVFILAGVVFIALSGNARTESLFSRFKKGNKAESYFPLDIGNKWRYETTVIDSEGAIRDRDDTIITVTGREKIIQSENTKHYAVVFENAYSPQRKLYFRCDGDTLFLFDAPYFDCSAEPGAIRIITDKNNAGANVMSVLSETVTYLGTEDVCVPAGTFDACRCYTIHRTEIYIDTPKGVETVIDTDTRYWFAKGIGIVKMESAVTRNSVNETKNILTLLGREEGK